MKLVDDVLTYCAAFAYLVIKEIPPGKRSLIVIGIILGLVVIALAALQGIT